MVDGSMNRASRRPIGGVSHVRGAQHPPLIELTIPQQLKQTVAKYADRPAAVFCAAGQRWTYAEMARKVDALAAGLDALGLVKGDRIGIWGPNSPEWVLTQYATARLGLVMVNINPAYRLAELEFALNKVGCRAIIIAERFKSSDYVGMIQALAPELAERHSGRLNAGKLPKLEYVIQMGGNTAPGMLRFDDVVASGERAGTQRLDAISDSLSNNDPINIQFTSGTTGLPKGATLTHRNIINNAYFAVMTQAFTAEDRLCVPVPLYHCFGMVLGSLGCVTAGACVVYPGEGFEPQATLAAVSKERCTSVYGVPSMFSAMLDVANFKDYDLKSLRTGVMAGAPCPIELMKRVIAEMNMRETTICYGMTETSPVSFQSDIDDPLDRRVSTIGRVHPHVEARIVDLDGNTVPPGVQGEVCVKGYSVMLGYWDDEAKTKDSIRDGWMHTGDLGVIDDEGYASIVGRLKDMVIRGGENIYPREVEEFLLRNEKIREVQVFGVPDDHFGEELCAWIVCREGQTATEDEIREFCKGKISHYKVPRYIRFRDELPLTATGKAQKFKMRDMMIEELKLSK
jgi:fatty-acyl-CoA synthase